MLASPPSAERQGVRVDVFPGIRNVPVGARLRKHVALGSACPGCLHVTRPRSPASIARFRVMAAQPTAGRHAAVYCNTLFQQMPRQFMLEV